MDAELHYPMLPVLHPLQLGMERTISVKDTVGEALMVDIPGM
jgi:hypothetical protein